jgi:HSP20 family protein
MNLIKKANNDVFQRFFDDEFTRDFFGLTFPIFPNMTGIKTPAVNISETNDAYVIEAAAPGYNKEDFKLELEDNVLILSCEKKTENEENNKNYSRKEYSYTSFKRSFNLPEGKIDLDKINANYENGILKIALPKKAELTNKTQKLITIK